MKLNRRLLLASFAVAIAACSQPNGSMDDLGTSPADLGTQDGQNDLSTIDGARPPWMGLSLIAGSAGGQGNANDVGPNARFNAPCGGATDALGNLYISDNGYNASTIRKIVLATGATSAIAGSSSMSGSADGTGSAALFDSACGLAADGMGNLYVADSRNSTIRKIVLSTGTVTTVAGSAGLSGSSDGTGGTARFGRPTSLALDGAGNLYVADASNSTVRKVTLATGMVTTIAGKVIAHATDRSRPPAMMTAPCPSPRMARKAAKTRSVTR